ncbi:unnamed protein product [Schistosoma mattheei]|uniref:Uncharacterized protein n=1 Tax=Schistosoma mattheei TaxID=31246 RepID=A0A3P8E0F1_9TREM|nr:unnamed protein product [Schistosoma mattheei]
MSISVSSAFVWCAIHHIPPRAFLCFFLLSDESSKQPGLWITCEGIKSKTLTSGLFILGNMFRPLLCGHNSALFPHEG